MWVSDAKKNDFLKLDQGDYYHHYQKKGSVYHDVVTGEKASVFIDGADVLMRVNCSSRAGGENLEIPYALVVTLDSDDVSLPIYEEVKNTLTARLKQKTNVEVDA